MSLKSPNFSRSFWTLLTRRPHTIWAFWILGTCKTYCNHISIWTRHNTSLHSFVKIILDHGSQTSTHFFQNPFIKKIFWIHFLQRFLHYWISDPQLKYQNKNNTYPYRKIFGPRQSHIFAPRWSSPIYQKRQLKSIWLKKIWIPARKRETEIIFDIQFELENFNWFHGFFF